MSVQKLVKDGGERRMEVVSLAQSLRLKRGVRRFLVYRNFSNGKTYLYPSEKLFDEGMRISLNGYETKVFTNIYEVEDIDGVYERLYNKYNGHGIQDLEHEIRILYLEPFFEAVEPIKGQKFFKDLKAILQGKGTSMNRRAVMQTLGSCYTYMEEFDSLFSKIGLNMHIMKPQTVLDILSSLDIVCRNQLFSNANAIMDTDIVMVFAASFLAMPFLSSHPTMDEAIRVVQHLQLSRFFEASESIISRCAIIIARGESTMEELLGDKSFLDLIGRNEYQGVRWFRGESFQECMYLTYLADAMAAGINLDPETVEDYRREIDSWLRKCGNAQYKLDNLLK